MICVAMSGGVDSSAAAAMLLEQGHEVVGLTMVALSDPDGLSPCGSAAARDAAAAAAHLGIPHHVVHLAARFEAEIIADFTREYLAGRTPNPCVRCNRAIKFGALLEEAKVLGASHLATGHYARVARRGERVALRRARAGAKDQSYVLAGLGQEQLARALFPLGESTKETIRAYATANSLPAAHRPESQEICFIPDNDYRGFLYQRVGPGTPGPIISTAGEVLGEHHGIMDYTVGQRKGLGIAAPRPLYVIEIDTARNTLTVGYEEETYCDGLTADGMNWISTAPRADAFECRAQIRYLHTPVPATVTPAGNAVEVRFHEAVRSVTPGQWAVFYDDDEYVLGAGIISAAVRRP